MVTTVNYFYAVHQEYLSEVETRGIFDVIQFKYFFSFPPPTWDPKY